MAFDVQRVFNNVLNKPNDYVVEFTTIYKGRGAGKVYETSSAWMPMEATGVKLAFTKRSFVRS